MLKTINAVLASSGAAPVLGAKIIGRVIGQVARGFGKDEQLVSEISVYKAIAAKYPKDTITLNAMFKTMRGNSNPVVEQAVDTSNMSDEEKALWVNDDVSEREQLDASVKELTAVFMSAPADIKAWNDLPTIAQWSLLNAIETALPNKIAQYSQWASNDRNNGKTNTNAMRLQAEAEAAVPVVYELITEFLANKNVAADLAADREAGIAVPVRKAA